MVKKVYVYGAGNMGVATLHILQNNKLEVEAVLDNNDQLQGKLLRGVKITRASSIDDGERKYAVVVVAISAIPYIEIKKYLSELGYEEIVPAGDYLRMITQKEIINVWKNNEKVSARLIDEASCAFDDSQSLAEWKQAVGWFENRNEFAYSSEHTNISRDKYFPDIIKNHIAKMTHPVMLDVSLLDGSYVQKFYEIYKAGKVYANKLYPESIDQVMEKEIKKKYPSLHIFNHSLGVCNSSLIAHRIGIMEPFTADYSAKIDYETLDSVFENIDCNYIRAYSIDPILPILRNGLKIIKRCKPAIAINISHYKTDFEGIFQFIKELPDSYRFYFRMHSYQGNDCIVYAIPNMGDMNYAN